MTEEVLERMDIVQSILSKDDILEHHGIRGMKWGVRRSQEELGYSTPRKKDIVKARIKNVKASGRLEAKRIKAENKQQIKINKTQAKVQQKLNKVVGPKLKKEQKNPLSDLSDAELQSRINRMRLENQYKELAPVPKKSAGKKIIESVMRDVFAPAARSAGKDLVDKYLRQQGEEKLGLKKQKTELEKLREQQSILESKSKIKQYTDYLEGRTDNLNGKSSKKNKDNNNGNNANNGGSGKKNKGDGGGGKTKTYTYNTVNNFYTNTFGNMQRNSSKHPDDVYVDSVKVTKPKTTTTPRQNGNVLLGIPKTGLRGDEYNRSLDQMEKAYLKSFKKRKK